MINNQIKKKATWVMWGGNRPMANHTLLQHPRAGGGGGGAVRKRQIQWRKIAGKWRCRHQTPRSLKQHHLCTGDTQGAHERTGGGGGRADGNRGKIVGNRGPPSSPHPCPPWTGLGRAEAGRERGAV